MDLTTVYWTICVALWVAICVMASGLVTIVLIAVEKYQRISEHYARR